jgi:hypothetical protein
MEQLRHGVGVSQVLARVAVHVERRGRVRFARTFARQGRDIERGRGGRAKNRLNWRGNLRPTRLWSGATRRGWRRPCAELVNLSLWRRHDHRLVESD